MKLNYTFNEISQIITHKSSNDNTLIHTISFDTRRIINGKNNLFFALNGSFRNGVTFLDDAYEKGVRHFVVEQRNSCSHLKGASEIIVEDSLTALETLAKYHRAKINCPVVAITGSHGKTTVKEWLSILLNGQKNISKSPKSYNSRLGVALSLLEINNSTDVAIIEVGIGEKGVLKHKKEIIQPTYGIFTSFGKAHRELFTSDEEHFLEKLSLFKKTPFLYPEHNFPRKISLPNAERISIMHGFFDDFLLKRDEVSKQNLSLAIRMAQILGLSDEEIIKRIPLISQLAQRMEIFDGKNNNTIINDTYNLDVDSLEYSLSYQFANTGNKKRIALIGTSDKSKYQSIIEKYNPIEVHFIDSPEKFHLDFVNSSILITGTRDAKMEIVVQQLKAINHQTYLEFNLKSIRHNIQFFKTKLNSDTKLLCMVKASSYGTDAKNMGTFLENMGVDYLGVAYVNEGIELRKKGINTPILVMNCEESSFTDCINYKLEPAIYSLPQLDNFVKTLIAHSEFNYPIHLKIETGMNRLGFVDDEIQELLTFLHAQPEIKIKSIYSHLAESDVTNSKFTLQQIKTFEKVSNKICKEFTYPILRHILNSEGIKNYTSAQFDMVRLGIGMYGVNGEKELRQAISWHSSISQIKNIKKGDSVGYNRSFIAEEELQIAIIPVGYADGLARNLAQNNFGVYIHNDFCPLVGTICMDMLMVDVSKITARVGDKVEIIGENQSVLDLASKMGTISYEVMTRFSSRLHRKYID